MSVEKTIAVSYASEQDENGWKLDYGFLTDIKSTLDAKYRWSCNVDLEEIEAIILILLNEFDLVDS